MQRIFSALRRLMLFTVLTSAALLFGCTVDSALPEMTAAPWVRPCGPITSFWASRVSW